MNSEISFELQSVLDAIVDAGRDPALRAAIMAALRAAEAQQATPSAFRETVRWPLILGLLKGAGTHPVTLDSGLTFELGADSRIERSALLSNEEHPDHIWEPQTTKLLKLLAVDAGDVIVGGAYIGDQVLPMAKVMADGPGGTVHAFEPMQQTYDRLVYNIALNGLTNIVAHRMGLWDVSDTTLRIEGDFAIGSSVEISDASEDGAFKSIAIDDYVASHGIDRVGLIMIDTEGGEERTLAGAKSLLTRPSGEAPNLVFEVHRFFVDWSDGLENTSIIKSLTDQGYTSYAIRDLHDNHSMAGQPIEVTPIERTYVEGPPHGFNVIATKDAGLIARLGLEVVPDVSPKLLPDRDPALHHPRRGF